MNETLEDGGRLGKEVARLRQPNAAYHRARTIPIDEEVISVGRGTDGGEYLRRTWQPVCLSKELGDVPLVVRMLDEELVLFRTGAGELGLVEKYCSHRGASLEYGLPTEQGLQCCYHGWHYAPDGSILETPNDPDSKIKERLYHPAYPVYEYSGIIFAYLGPPEDVPEFPILDTYQQPDTRAVPFSLYFPCNWIQVLDNTQDPTHSCFLHTRVSGAQFAVSWGELPELSYVDTPLGMININVRRWNNHVWVRTTDVMLPNLNQTGHLWISAEYEETFLRCALTRWMRPIDDTHTQMIGWRFFNERLDRDSDADPEQVGVGKIDFIGQTEDERPYADRQRVPGDYEAIAGQGDVALNAAWNLNTGDRGVAMLRKIIRDNIQAVRDGNEFVSVDRSSKVDGVVPTYTQDTVVTIPPKNGDDRSMMREVGDKVSRLVFDSANLADPDRETAFAEKLAAVVQSYAD